MTTTMNDPSEPAEFFLDLTDLVPRRETCEKMSERGFDMVTHFFWDHDRILRAERGFHPSPVAARLPAPTAAELGRVLPLKVRYEGVPYFLSLDPRSVYYITGDERMMFAQKSARTEAEARARLWLRLESEGLLPEDDD
jgi:hypothetical protein